MGEIGIGVFYHRLGNGIPGHTISISQYMAEYTSTSQFVVVYTPLFQYIDVTICYIIYLNFFRRSVNGSNVV